MLRVGELQMVGFNASSSAYPQRSHCLLSFEGDSVSLLDFRPSWKISALRFGSDVIFALKPRLRGETCGMPHLQGTSSGVSPGIFSVLGKKANSPGRMMSDFHTKNNTSRISKLI